MVDWFSLLLAWDLALLHRLLLLSIHFAVKSPPCDMLPSFLMILIELAKMAEPLHDELLVHSSHQLCPSLFILLHRNGLDWVLKCTFWSCFNDNCQLLSLVKSVAMNSRLMGKLVDRNGEVMFEQKPEISYSEKYFSYLLICMCKWAYFIGLGALAIH